jgi:hypothetical protein
MAAQWARRNMRRIKSNAGAAFAHLRSAAIGALRRQSNRSNDCDA